MPFLVPEKLPQHNPVVIAVRSVAPKTGCTSIVWKIAADYVQNGKKVLIFDELLGLPNTHYKNKNEQLIPSVLAGENPLNQLVDTVQGIDFIAGQSLTNLHSLSNQEKSHIRIQLTHIIQSYDYVILDSPSQCSESFLPANEMLWVCLPIKEHLFNTIQQAAEPIKIVLNKVQQDTNIANLNLYLKQLSNNAQISRQFPIIQNDKDFI